jgi:hypothetical protein
VTTLAPAPSGSPTRPTALRRAAVVGAGVLACALPTIWGAGTVGELLTGAERDHLFHQVTGQGLLLSGLCSARCCRCSRPAGAEPGRRPPPGSPTSLSSSRRRSPLPSRPATAARSSRRSWPSPARWCGSPCRSGRGWR